MKPPVLTISAVALAFTAIGGVVASARQPTSVTSIKPDPCCSEYRFNVSGSVQHRKISDDMKIDVTGARADYSEEIYGKSFFHLSAWLTGWQVFSFGIDGRNLLSIPRTASI